MKNEIRVVTNDRYAQHPCVVDEKTFVQMCADAGFETCDFTDCGPVVETENDVREHCGETAADECVRQLRALAQATPQIRYTTSGIPY